MHRFGRVGQLEGGWGRVGCMRSEMDESGWWMSQRKHGGVSAFIRSIAPGRISSATWIVVLLEAFAKVRTKQ